MKLLEAVFKGKFGGREFSRMAFRHYFAPPDTPKSGRVRFLRIHLA